MPAQRRFEAGDGSALIETKPRGQKGKLSRFLRKHRARREPPELQPMLRDPEEPVRQGKMRSFPFEQEARAPESFDRIQCCPDADLRVIPAGDQLEKLHVEFDVANSARPLFQVDPSAILRVFLLRTVFDPLDFLERRVIHLPGKSKICGEVTEAAPEVLGPGDKPRLYERLALPGFTPGLVVSDEACQ